MYFSFLVVSIVAYSVKSVQNSPELHQDLNLLSPSAIPIFFGIAVFNFEGNGLVLNLHASMKDQTKFERVLNHSLAAYIVLLISFATFSYYVIKQFSNEVFFVRL
jgi:amino acid permease